LLKKHGPNSKRVHKVHAKHRLNQKSRLSYIQELKKLKQNFFEAQNPFFEMLTPEATIEATLTTTTIFTIEK